MNVIGIDTSWRRAGRWARALFLLLLFAAAVPLHGAPQQDLTGPVAEAREEAPELAAEPLLGAPARKTIAPWIVDVYGRNYDSFTNEGASRVISDWLTNALIDLGLFNVVERERIRAVLSERNLALSGMARDVSSDVPQNELATAGRILSVNYILLGNVKNLGSTSEIDFKLLDVTTTTYASNFRLNFEVPFNPKIEKFKLVVDRIVGDLAASFPVLAGIREITADGHLVLEAGSSHGIEEGLSAEVCPRGGAQCLVTGVITSAEPWTAEMSLDDPYPLSDLWSHVVRISIAPGAELVLNKGRLEMKRGNYAAAREVLAAGIETYSGHGRILALHGRSCWQLRDYTGAVASYRDALKAEPNDMELLAEASRVLFEAGYFQEVVELLEGLATRPLELELQLGDALIAQGYPLLAREAYKRAFRLDPESPWPHLRLAVLAARVGEVNEIQRELALAREGAGGSIQIELASIVGQALESDEPNLEGVEPWIERAVEDGDFEALTTAAELALFRQDLWQFGLELARKSVELNPSFLQGRRLVAEALVLGGETEQAVAMLEQALEEHANNVALLVRSAELLAAADRHREAELRLVQAMDLAPLQWRPADALGDVYFRQDSYLEAIDAYQKALQVAEKAQAPDLTLRLQKLGRAAVLGDQHATAAPYLERCVSREPDNMECRYYLGLCDFVSRLEQSDDRAIVNLRAAAGFHADSNYYLGALHERREELEEAVGWYEKCVDSGCAREPEARARIEAIERVRGTVVGHTTETVNLDVGRIHGVQPSQPAIVVSANLVIARVRVEQVQEKTSVAKILKGRPLTGHEVLFRPPRPRGLTVEPAEKRGVLLKWNRVADPDLAHYLVYRKSDIELDWQQRKRLDSRSNRFLDKTVKPGREYSYRIAAVNNQRLESLASNTSDIEIED